MVLISDNPRALSSERHFVMGDGIAATNDPVLLFRSPSYALSFTKRLQGK
jgi:hypothetical protein